MKTKYARPLFFFFIASLLASCSLMQKHEFAQRKYYDFPRGKHKIETKQQEEEVVRTEKTVTEKIIAVKEEAPVVTASTSRSERPAPAKKKAVVPSVNPAPAAAITPAVEEERLFTPKKVKALKMMEKVPFSPRSSDTMLILLVLCAIFIPPLACFIKNDNRIDQWFWITLILCILSGGIWGWGYSLGGLLWLAAMIIALLVVFEAL